MPHKFLQHLRDGIPLWVRRKHYHRGVFSLSLCSECGGVFPCPYYSIFESLGRLLHLTPTILECRFFREKGPPEA